MSWLPVIVLPNVDLRVPVVSRFAAVAGYNDPLVCEVCRRLPSFSTFLDHFSDAFREQQRPSVIFLCDKAPETIKTGPAVAAYRDLLAMCVIPFNRAAALVARRRASEDSYFSNSFAFYPWMVDRHDEGLLALTPAMSGYHELAAFSGQISPELSPAQVTALDEPLLALLLHRWEHHFTASEPAWEDEKLFRSLNMANHAARTPFLTPALFMTSACKLGFG